MPIVNGEGILSTNQLFRATGTRGVPRRRRRLHIAYQTVGEGPSDLVFLPGIVSNVALAWEEPHWADFYELALVGGSVPWPGSSATSSSPAW